MNVGDFDFELPEELIAQEPAPRGESRLLVLSERPVKSRTPPSNGLESSCDPATCSW
jgi:S-adenosylmethionine:tRNA-ribosyltransferase-isomerase (queuine synthetase)